MKENQITGKLDLAPAHSFIELTEKTYLCLTEEGAYQN
jgi:hypothetical protein